MCEWSGLQSVAWLLPSLLLLSNLPRGRCGSFTTVGSACHITDSGSCVQSQNYPNAYLIDDASNTQDCTLNPGAGNAQALHVVAFSTETGFDTLSINGQAYSGPGTETVAPPDGIIPSGDMPWTTDATGVQVATGWRLCLEDADPGAWTQIDSTSIPARDDQSLVSTGTVLLMFGGTHNDGSQIYRSDLWQYDGSAWSKLNEATLPGLHGHTAVYDPVSNGMLVFAGYANGVLGNNFYRWRIQFGNWVVVTGSGTVPDAREGHTAVYSSVNTCMLVFGGWDSSAHRNDLACWDVTANAWISKAAHSTSGRSHHIAVVNSDGTQMLIHGGDDGSAKRSDLWRYDVAADSWTALSPTAGRAYSSSDFSRWGHAAAWATDPDCLIFFGGLDTSSVTPDHRVWCYSMEENKWKADGNPGGSPPNGGTGDIREAKGAMLGQEFYIFYGDTQAETFKYTVPNSFKTQAARNVAGTWAEITVGANPPPRYLHQVVATPQGVLLHGGVYDDAGYASTPYTSYYADLWKLNAGVWTELSTSNGAERWFHAAVYDPVNDALVVYGGLDTSHNRLADIQSCSLQTGQWSLWTPVTSANTPGGRYGHSAVYAGSNRYMLVYGGFEASGQHVNALYGFDMTAGDWVAALSTASSMPGRSNHAAVVNSDSTIMYIHGGQNTVTPSLSDLWMYDIGADAWGLLAPQSTGPGIRYHHAAVWAGACMLIYGGLQNQDSEADHYLWCYDPAANRWMIDTSAGGTPPTGKIWQNHAAVDGDTMYISGGQMPTTTDRTFSYVTPWTFQTSTTTSTATTSTTTSTTTSATTRSTTTSTATTSTTTSATTSATTTSTTTPSATTTTVTYTSTVQADNVWAQLVPITSLAPSARQAFSMVFWEQGGTVLVFGGFNPGNQNTVYNDLWAYSVQGNFWGEKTAAASPRHYHTAVISTDGRCMLVYGGWAVGQGPFLEDLWCYDVPADAWSEISPTNPPLGRVAHSAVMSNDGHMYIFAGFANVTDVPGGTYVNSIYSYSVQNNAWTEVTPTGIVPEALVGQTAHLVQDCMYIYGGTNFTGHVFSNVDCFNVVTHEYTRLNSGGRAVSWHAGALASSFDCILFWGGLDSSYSVSSYVAPECFNYVDNQWESRDGNNTQQPYMRTNHNAVYIPSWDAQLFFMTHSSYQDMEMWVFKAGTTTTSTTITTATSTFTATDQVESSWVFLQPFSAIPDPRSDHTAVYTNRSGSGLVFIHAGQHEIPSYGYGSGGISLLNDVWVYSLQANLWVQKSSSPWASRIGHSAVMSPVDDCMLVYGGRDASNAYLSDHYCYDTSFDTWTSLGSLSSSLARAWHAAVVTDDGKVLFSGGLSDTLTEFSMLQYNRVNGAWTILAVSDSIIKAQPRFSHTAVLIGNCMYIYGGTWQSTIYNNLLCFNIQTNDFVNLGWNYIPIARHAAAWAPEMECMLFYGGTTSQPSMPNAPHCYRYKEDSFEQSPAGIWNPTEREQSTAVYVPEWSAVLFFGGYHAGSGSYLSDLWSYRGTVATTSTSMTITNTSTSTSTISTSATSSSTWSSSTTSTSQSLTTSISLTSSSSRTATSSSTRSATSTISTSETVTTATSTTTSQTRTSSTSTSVTVTTTRTPSTNVTASFEELAAAQAAALAKLLALAQNSSEVVTSIAIKEPDGTEVVAAAIKTEEAFQDVVLQMEAAAVAIPADDLGAASAALASLGADSDLFGLLNDSLNGSGLVLASPPLSIELWDANGDPITGDLPVPLKFNLTAGNSSSEPGAACKYWDEVEEAWSSRGVTTLSAQDGSVACSTMHLSLFAIILDTIVSTLVCSNAASIFSLEGLESLLYVGWIIRLPAILNWVMIAMGVFLLSLARRADLKQRVRLQELQRTVDACTLSRHGNSHRQKHSLQEELKQNCCGVLRLDLTRSISSVVVRRRTGMGLDALDRMYLDAGNTVTHDLAKTTLQKFHGTSLRQKLFFLYKMNCAFIHVLDPRMTSSSMQRCAAVVTRVYSGWAVSAVFYGATALAPDQPDCVPPETLLEKVIRAVVIAWITTVVGAIPLATLIAICQKVLIIPRRYRLTFFWTVLFLYFLLCLMVVCIFIASVSPSDSEKWFISAFTSVLQTTFLSPMLLAFLMVLWLQCRRLEAVMAKEFKKWQPSGKLQEVRLDRIALPDATLKKILKTNELVHVVVTCQVAGRGDVITLQETNGTYRSDKPYKLEPNQVLIISVYKIEKKKRTSQVDSGFDRMASDSSQLSSWTPEPQTDAGRLRKPIASAYLEAGQLGDGGFEGALPLYDKNKRDLRVSLEAKTVTPEPALPLSRVEESHKAAATTIQVLIEEEPMMEIQPASSDGTEADEESLEVPTELQRPIVLMSLETPEQADSNSKATPRETPMEMSGPRTEASVQHASGQMQQGEMTMEMLPPPIEEPPQQPEEQALALPPPATATLTLPSPPTSKKVLSATPSPMSGRSAKSRRKELTQQAEADPNLADLIKASENRFRARSATPSPRSRHNGT